MAPKIPGGPPKSRTAGVINAVARADEVIERAARCMSLMGPGRVETFFVSPATGRDGPRRDRLSLFLLYRVWSQPEGRAERHVRSQSAYNETLLMPGSPR